jgi:hypothetical protein
MYQRLQATHLRFRDVQRHRLCAELPIESSAELQRNVHRTECGLQWDVPKWTAHLFRQQYLHQHCGARLLFGFGL